MHIHSYAMKHFWNNIGNAWMTRILPRQFLHMVKQELKWVQLTPTKRSKMQLCASWLWARKTWVKWYTLFHLELVSQVGSAKTEDCKQAIQFPKNLLQIRVILTTAILIEMGMTELNTSQDSGLSIGTAFFYWSCFWYFLSLIIMFHVYQKQMQLRCRFHSLFIRACILQIRT